MMNRQQADSIPATLSSLALTAFIALFLYLVPVTIVGYLFKAYADAVAIANVGQWLAEIETMVIMTFTIYFLILPIVYFSARSLSKEQTIAESLTLKHHSARELGIVVVISIVFWLAFTALSLALALPEEPFIQQLKYSDLPLWFICLNVCVMAPIVEEIVFRGLLFNRIASTKLAKTGAIVITGSLFAVIHGQYTMLGMIMVFILGMYFTWLRIRYHSTNMAIVGHSVCNSLTVITLYLLT